MASTARKRTYVDETKRPGEPGYLRVEDAAPVKAPTKAEIQWSMLRRMENASGRALSKVTITRNAKHEYQFSVESVGEDAEKCSEEAQRLAAALEVIYPSPPAVTTEVK